MYDMIASFFLHTGLTATFLWAVYVAFRILHGFVHDAFPTYPLSSKVTLELIGRLKWEEVSFGKDLAMLFASTSIMFIGTLIFALVWPVALPISAMIATAFAVRHSIRKRKEGSDEEDSN